MDSSGWEVFDGMICGVVDRLRMKGYKYTLEVEFRVHCMELSGEVDREMFLPKFREKGRVMIAEVSSGRFREWL